MELIIFYVENPENWGFMFISNCTIFTSFDLPVDTEINSPLNDDKNLDKFIVKKTNRGIFQYFPNLINKKRKKIYFLKIFIK